MIRLVAQVSFFLASVVLFLNVSNKEDFVNFAYVCDGCLDVNFI